MCRLRSPPQAEEEDLGSLETTFQQIKIVTGLSDVDDIVQKFKYRADKTRQLEAVAEDVRQRIETLREENHAQRAHLEDMRADCEVTAGNREIFQEMDKYNSELADALRTCEESKARAIRSSVTLEELKVRTNRSPPSRSSSLLLAPFRAACVFFRYSSAPVQWVGDAAISVRGTRRRSTPKRWVCPFD